MLINGKEKWLSMVRAIEDLLDEGIYHFLDTLYYDCYVVCYEARNIINAVLYLGLARDLAQTMVGAEDNRVVGLNEMLLAILTEHSP